MKNLKIKQMLIIIIPLVMCLLALAGAKTLWAAEPDHISAVELKRLIDSGDRGFLVMDVQPQGAYKAGHIKGAINFPWQPELPSDGNLPRDKMLILYCDCSHEEDSIDAAVQLKEKWDYTNIKLLEGGWSGWVKLGYPVEK